MNEELTMEVLEAMVKCDTICSRCKSVKLCSEGIFNTLRILATALLEERAKAKVWDGAPEWATIGRVCWTGKKHGEAYSKLYHRELPKTRARQIAENIVHGIYGGANDKDIEYVEGVLKRYAEELKDEA